MQWEKLGRIIVPDASLRWHQTHAMMPTPSHIESDLFRIYFSGRDSKNISHIGAVVLDINRPHRILDKTIEPVLGPGELGCFDDNGVTPSCAVNLGDRTYLYYVGWKPRSTTRMSVVAGLAESFDGGQTFRRVSRAPILRRTDQEPHGIMTAPCVLREGDRWRMWYVSGVEWVHPDLPRYNIKYAESKDGISWEQNAMVAIDSRDERESALARPCVIRDGNRYKMWYSHKDAGADYTIGYAESIDGLQWERMDHVAGIARSSQGWDSEMIEYGFVLKHADAMYMFYNGNNYGANGAGIAVLRK
jgi:predicted GH43/DUF377 family glycosyl hydrolase